MKKRSAVAIIGAALALSACQSVQTAKPVIAQKSNAIQFETTGKIGITTQTETGREGGSAFYAWSQNGNSFAIDLTGALGIGATQIRYNGQTATLNSERTGLIEAKNPEDLLLQATGWQAPISHLPYWIVGRKAPSDSAHTTDSAQRLNSATNGAWTANFSYNNTDTRPKKLDITHVDGHRVILTITHQ